MTGRRPQADVVPLRPVAGCDRLGPELIVLQVQCLLQPVAVVDSLSGARHA